MSYEVYSQEKHPRPYTYVIEKHGQYLYYFGAKHSFDPNDQQFKIIEDFFTEFITNTKKQNCAVLVEGGARPVLESKEKAIQEGGEMHYMVYLAHKAGIASFSPEIPDRLKFEKLLEKFTKEEIAYYDFVQVCYQWNNMSEIPDFDEYMNRFLKRNHEDIGWDDFDFSIENLITIHKKIFNTEFDKNDKQFFYDIVNPTTEKTIINRISRDASEQRDLYALDQIDKYWSEGKNIFIIYGYTHAVMQEPVLQTLDQPTRDILDS